MPFHLGSDPFVVGNNALVASISMEAAGVVLVGDLDRCALRFLQSQETSQRKSVDIGSQRPVACELTSAAITYISV